MKGWHSVTRLVNLSGWVTLQLSLTNLYFINIWRVDLCVKTQRIRNGNFPSLKVKCDLSQQLEHVCMLAQIILMIGDHYGCQADSIKLYKGIILDVRTQTAA